MFGEEMEAVYDRSGEKKVVMTEIKRKKLPQTVQETLKRDFADYDFESFYKVEKEGKTKYKVEAEKDGKTEKLIFDYSGKLIEKNKRNKSDKKHEKENMK